MPKRALDEDDCIDGGSDESVIVSSEPHVSRKDDEDDDADGQSESSAVMESSASDETSPQTDTSADVADTCATSM